MVESQQEAFRRLSWKDVISQNEAVVKSLRGLASDTPITEWSKEQQDPIIKNTRLENWRY